MEQLRAGGRTCRTAAAGAAGRRAGDFLKFLCVRRLHPAVVEGCVANLRLRALWAARR